MHVLYEHEETVLHCTPIGVPVPGIQAYIGGLNWIKLINKADGSVEKTIKARDFHFMDTAVTREGDLLVSSEKEIKKLTPNGLFLDYVRDTLPYAPYGLVVTENDEVIICLRKEGSPGKIMRLSLKGIVKALILQRTPEQIMTEFQFDENRKPFFSWPYRIGYNQLSGDTWVSDADLKHVIVLDRKGKFLFRYYGPPGIPRIEPMGLTVTRDQETLISDFKMETVHRVDKKGQFLQFFITKLQGVSMPRSIALDSVGDVWMGMWSHQVVIAKIKYSEYLEVKDVETVAEEIRIQIELEEAEKEAEKKKQKELKEQRYKNPFELNEFDNDAPPDIDDLL